MSAAETMNYSNIPPAPFSENVEKLASAREGVPETLRSFQTLMSYGATADSGLLTARLLAYRKYRMMEEALKNKKDRFDGLLGELDASIATVEQLRQAVDLQYDFELGSTLYARATIPSAGRRIGLWLGAGIMLEYEREEALAFLTGKRDDRQEEIRKVEHDLTFIRKQITTMEVNMARLYNLAVRRQTRQNQ